PASKGRRSPDPWTGLRVTRSVVEGERAKRVDGTARRMHLERARGSRGRTMRVSIFGLGYVGCVSAASLAAEGHEVVGVDVNPERVDGITEGGGPIVEPGLDELLKSGVTGQRLRATTDTAEAVHATDLSLICVGTPSRKNGSLDLTYLTRVCEQIGDVLKDK